MTSSADTIRAGLANSEAGMHALTALTELEQQLADLRDDRVLLDLDHIERLSRRAVTAEADRDQLTKNLRLSREAHWADRDKLNADRDRLADTARALLHVSEQQIAVERDRDRLADTLREIDATEVDWTQGTDENCERLKDIARAALATPDTPPDA